MKKRENEYRDPVTKQYAYFGDFGRMCVCGHTLGVHCAGGFECNIGDPESNNKGCKCPKFQPQRLTKAQKEMLERIGAAVREYTPIEYNFGNKTKVCERLVKMGLASHYPHGGFTITEYGRVVLTESKGGK